MKISDVVGTDLYFSRVADRYEILIQEDDSIAAVYLSRDQILYLANTLEKEVTRSLEVQYDR